MQPNEETLAHRPIITLTADLGINDHFDGAMKGVILEIVPEAAIVAEADRGRIVGNRKSKQAFPSVNLSIAPSVTFHFSSHRLG